MCIANETKSHLKRAHSQTRLSCISLLYSFSRTGKQLHTNQNNQCLWSLFPIRPRHESESRPVTPESLPQTGYFIFCRYAAWAGVQCFATPCEKCASLQFFCRACFLKDTIPACASVCLRLSKFWLLVRLWLTTACVFQWTCWATWLTFSGTKPSIPQLCPSLPWQTSSARYKVMITNIHCCSSLCEHTCNVETQKQLQDKFT